MIIISAMGQVLNDRIRGLRMGADDYLSKPFQIGELLARVETVLRRTKQIQDKITIGDVTIDPVSRLVFKCGKQVDLTVKEFDILALLITHPQRVFTYELIMELVWNEDVTFYSRKAVSNHMSNLRKKLKRTPDGLEYIKNVVGVGYKFEVL